MHWNQGMYSAPDSNGRGQHAPGVENFRFGIGQAFFAQITSDGFDSALVPGYAESTASGATDADNVILMFQGLLRK